MKPKLGGHYNECFLGASVLQEYWKIDVMGHTWSGGRPGNSYTDPSGPNVNLAMFQFFMSHPMDA